MQFFLGGLYEAGMGVPLDLQQAVKWWRRSAEQDFVLAERQLGVSYLKGYGVTRDYVEAARWLRRAADKGDGVSQSQLAALYLDGRGVPQDRVLAYVWANLAASANPHALDTSEEAQGLREKAARARDRIASLLSPADLAAGQRLSRAWRPKEENAAATPSEATRTTPARPSITTGTGILVDRSGHLATNAHVVDDCREVHVDLGSTGKRVARLIAADRQNDLALLHVSGLSIPRTAMFRDKSIRQGESIVVLGFPLVGVLGSGPHLTTGIVSALTGLGDDSRYFQMTAPVQPGHSGGPVFDQAGNVVGVVTSKLDAMQMARTTGDIPQNVNFAIHASVTKAFLDTRGVQYAGAATAPHKVLPTDKIGEHARPLVAIVECRR